MVALLAPSLLSVRGQSCNEELATGKADHSDSVLNKTGYVLTNLTSTRSRSRQP